MPSMNDDPIDSLNAQLAAILEGGSGARIELDGDERHRALAARLNALLDASRARANTSLYDPKLGLFLDSILENAPQMIFVKDAKSYAVELWNKAAEEVTGVRREAILGTDGAGVYTAE